MQKVLQQSEPGKRALNKLKNQYQDLKSELDSKKQAIKNLRKQILQKSMVLSQEAQNNKKSKLKKKLLSFRSLYQKYQKKMRSQEEKFRQPIIKKIVNIIYNYGKKQNYDLILDKDNSGVVFNADYLEITEKILSKLNKQWEASQKEK